MRTTHEWFFPRNARDPRPALRAARSLLAAVAASLLLAACGTTTTPSDGLSVEVRQEGLAAQRLRASVVTGTVSVSVSGPQDLSEVSFFVGDDAEPVATDAEAPFGFDLDTTTLSDGPHALVVEATAGDGDAPFASEEFYVANETGGVLPEGAEPFGEDAGADADAPAAADLPAPTLFAAPDGDPAGEGRSADAPVSVQRAAELVEPGDVVYLRGGVYPIGVTFTRSGTSGEPITWASHPGEWAIFDGSGETPVASSARFHLSGASWNVFTDLEVRNGPREGIYVDGSHDNVFRDVVTHGHQYSGIGNIRSDRNLYEGITTYDNFDDANPRGLYGDDADGIALSSGDANVVRRVVTYANSDDGIDAWRSTNTVIENVVAYDNGRGSHGNGNGIKAGGAGEANATIVRGSIAFDNKAHGFDDNSGQGIVFENNTAYDNGGYAYMGGPTTVRRNNIAVGGEIGMWGSQDQSNSWDLGIDDPGFASTDPGSDAFMTLAPGSPAIGAGAGGADLGAIATSSDYGDLVGPRTLGAAAGAGAGAIASR